MSKSQFTNTSPDEAQPVTEFLTRILVSSADDPGIDPRHLQWKNWDPRPDWPGSRGYVITQDRIVAHATVVPLALTSGAQRWHLAHLIDWAAAPKSVGSGVTLLKKIGQTVDAILVVGGSEMTQKILPALGFKLCGQVQRYVRPLRPLRRLQGKPLDWRLAAKVARSLVWKATAPAASLSGWEAQTVTAEGLAGCGVPWPRSQGETLLFERSAEVMAYYLRCPAAPMEFHAVRKDSVVRGYFMLSFAPAQARLVDLWVDSADPQDWRALVQLAVRQAALRPDVAEIVSMANDPLSAQGLLASGFHAHGSDPLRLLAPASVEFPSGAIGFRMLDSDAAYLHKNKPESWA